MSRARAIVASLLFTMFAGSCAASDFASQNCNLELTRQCGQAAESVCLDHVSEQVVDTRTARDRDILFVIDNSASMAQKQDQIARTLQYFMQKLEPSGENYHVGVITGDIGTLPPGSPASNPSDPRCGTLKGDDGLLQNRSCRDRTQNVSAEFRAACDAHCPTSITPTQRFIGKDNGILNVADPVAAIKCLGLVGDSGCEVQAPLEAMKRMLDLHLLENQEFLHDNAQLAIYFITDKDDYSVKLLDRKQLDPAAMDCGTTNPNPGASCYNREYRGTAMGIVCNEAMYVAGAKTGCRERTNSFLEPIEKYSRFLTALKPADKLLLGGIWPPSMIEFEEGSSTPYGSGQLIVTSQDTPPSAATHRLNRGRGTDAACVNFDPTLTSDPQGYYGLSQLRLSAFKRRFDPSIWTEQSICDPANYSRIFNTWTAVGSLWGDCLGVNPDLDCNGDPKCLVGFVDDNQHGGIPDVFLPPCSTPCCASWSNTLQPYGPYSGNHRNVLDPQIVAACMPEPVDCYCAAVSTKGLCPSTALAGLWRKGNAQPPPSKVTNFRCSGKRPFSPPTY